MLWRCLRLLVLGDRSVRLDNECLERRCESGGFALGCCVVCGARGAATECCVFMRRREATLFGARALSRFISRSGVRARAGTKLGRGNESEFVVQRVLGR